MRRLLTVWVFTLLSVCFCLAQVPYFIDQEFDHQPIQSVNVIEMDHRGMIWLGTDAGLYRYDGDKYQSLVGDQSLHAKEITAIYADHKGKGLLWIGYRDGTIATLGADPMGLRQWSIEEGNPKARITGILRDSSGTLWIATYGEGLYLHNGIHLYNFNVDDGLADDQIYSMALASSGEVWVATDHGVSICSWEEGTKRIRNLDINAGLPDEIVYKIVATGQGMWLGFHNEGFCYYDLLTESISVQSLAWPHGTILDMALAPDQSLWLVTQSGGLVKYDLKDSTHVQIPMADMQISGPLSLDFEGNLWVAVDQRKLLRASLNVQLQSLEIGDVQAIIRGEGDLYWIGTANGLYSMDKMGVRKITGFDGNILSLYRDPYGSIWVGTFGDGIFCLDPASGNKISLTERDGLANGSIFSIDGYGDRIWLATLGGIVEIHNVRNVFRTGKIDFINLNNQKGLDANFFISVFVDSRDRVWFGTDGQGVNVLAGEVVTNLLYEGELPMRTVYCFAEDEAGRIWMGSAQDGLVWYEDSLYGQYIRDNSMNSNVISSIAVDTYGDLIIVHEAGIDKLSHPSGSMQTISTDIPLQLEEPAMNAIYGDEDGILIGGSDQMIFYKPLGVQGGNQQIFFDDILLFNNSIDFQRQSEFSHQENFLDFYLNKVSYVDRDNVSYTYKLEGLEDTWRQTRNEHVSFSNLAPGAYMMRVRPVVGDVPLSSKEISYSFLIKKPFWQRLWFLILSGVGVFGLMVLYQKYREARINRMASIERDRIEARYEILKAQINPHFLFNSFNNLANVVEEDPREAVQYIEKLSDYYRTIIQYRDHRLIPLEEELNLIRDFIYLLKRRFGKNLRVDINLSRTSMLIPPLTLQILIENAVKHNVIATKKPLFIKIKDVDDYLVVSNNMQPKKTQEPSTRFGLESINHWFELVSKKKVIISRTENEFIVKLPWLAIDKYESINR